MRFFIEDEDSLVYLGEMSKNPATALKNALKKWQTIQKANEAGILVRGGLRADTCNLCSIYAEVCGGCPITIYTGSGGCAGTSYVNAVMASTAKSQLKASTRMVKMLEKIIARVEAGKIELVKP